MCDHNIMSIVLENKSFLFLERALGKAMFDDDVIQYYRSIV